MHTRSHSADGAATTVDDDEQAQSPRVERDRAHAKPIASAAQAPRENVKYSVMREDRERRSGGQRPPLSDGRGPRSRVPRAGRAPPAGRARSSIRAVRQGDTMSIASMVRSIRSGKSRVASAYAADEGDAEHRPRRVTPAVSPRLRTRAKASATATYTSIRSTSRIDADVLTDHSDESAIHTPRATIRAANATRKRPGASTRSRMSRTVVGTRNASATQPHDCEK